MAELKSEITLDTKPKPVRSEDELGRKFDRCLADGLIKVGAGLGIGIIFSVVLFKRRSWPVFFGTGTGLGMSLSNCQHDLQGPYKSHCDKRKCPVTATPAAATTIGDGSTKPCCH
uniref:MICOS complex subunit MIC10 n=1 Tax=Romanomermis culicivorax TaxID=13658 RepID=A0A915K329_ROMCU